MASSTDPALALQRAIVTFLKADTVIAGIVKDRVYGLEAAANPTWPFVKYGYPIGTPDEAAGWMGAEIRVTIHAFAEDQDVIHRLNRAIGRGLDGADLTLRPALDDGALAYALDVMHVGSQVLPDGSSTGKFHGVVEFDAQVAEER